MVYLLSIYLIYLSNYLIKIHGTSLLGSVTIAADTLWNWLQIKTFFFLLDLCTLWIDKVSYKKNYFEPIQEIATYFNLYLLFRK